MTRTALTLTTIVTTFCLVTSLDSRSSLAQTVSGTVPGVAFVTGARSYSPIVENLDATIALAYRFFSMRVAFRSSLAMTLIKFLATRPSLLHGLVCPRRSVTRQCRTPGCPFALEETIADGA